MLIYLPLIVGMVATFFSVPLAILIANRYAMMDRPDARKVHAVPIPRIGGIAILIGLIPAIWIVPLIFQVTGSRFSLESLRSLLAICGAAAFIFLVGLVDDIRTVPSRYKLLAMIGGALTVCGGGTLIKELRFGSDTAFDFGWASWLVTVAFIIGVTVAISFIDGLDGLAAGLTLLASVVLTVIAVSGGHVSQAVLPMALCGVLIGFLYHNWHPARTFMGDCGSMTIGFLLGSTIVMNHDSSGSMRGLVLPCLAISVPLVDSLLTIFRRRYLQRRSMFSAERGHVHHKLLDRGLRHQHVVIVIYAVSVLCLGVGLVSLSFEGWGTLGGLSLLVPLLWGFFRLAGSVRTGEIVRALRSKRDSDRCSKRYRATFEDLQLEFHHVRTFGQWWEGICQAAEQLDFARMQLVLPSINGGAGEGAATLGREMNWETENSTLALADKIRATIPLAIDHGDAPTASVTVDIASNQTLESASERLGLFTRLLTEYSLLRIRRKEQNLRSDPKASVELKRSIGLETIDQPVAKGEFGHLRVAIVHDFLYTYCGAERVVEQLIEVFPGCDVFSLFDFLPDDQRGFLKGKRVTTSFIQHLPFARTKHRSYLPLMPLAIEQLDVSQYDLVISSSYVAAKGVITGPDQLHVCYCHSPVRFAWDLQHQYLHAAKLGFSPKGVFARTILHYLRNWDARSALGVDHFIANSEFVARRIKKVYRRRASVVHPPVDTERYELNTEPRDDFYLVAGRMVPYKRTDLLVRAFANMPDRKLVVIGEGPDFEKVKEIATDNVTLMGFQDSKTLTGHMRRAKALLFAAEEDFGIVPVEALACGTPVIAYGKGGVTESVIDGIHGVHYDQQTEASLIDAIERFEAGLDFGRFEPEVLRRQAEKFSNQSFTLNIANAVRTWSEPTIANVGVPLPGESSDDVSVVVTPATDEHAKLNGSPDRLKDPPIESDDMNEEVILPRSQSV